MVSKQSVTEIVNTKLADSEYYLIDVSVLSGNSIVVEIDSDNDVDVDFCADLNRSLHDSFGEELDDYNLEVGSAGLTSPFKVLKQYQKNIGNQVEVLTKNGRKLIGELTAADEQGFTIDVEKMERREGDKRPKKYIVPEIFHYDEVKYTKYIIEF